MSNQARRHLANFLSVTILWVFLRSVPGNPWLRFAAGAGLTCFIHFVLLPQRNET